MYTLSLDLRNQSGDELPSKSVLIQDDSHVIGQRESRCVPTNQSAVLTEHIEALSTPPTAQRILCNSYARIYNRFYISPNWHLLYPVLYHISGSVSHRDIYKY